MSQRRALLIQTALEAAIPLLGYFFWHWDLSFLLLFYLLDWLLAYGILIAKGRKRLSFSGSKQERSLLVQRGSAGLLLIAAGSMLFGSGIVQLHPELHWGERVTSFLLYKDLGIEQGYVLIPLIVINGILQYRQQFLMTGRYRSTTTDELTRPFIFQGMLLLAIGALFLGIASLVSFPEMPAVILLIGGTSAYRLLVLRSN